MKKFPESFSSGVWILLVKNHHLSENFLREYMEEITLPNIIKYRKGLSQQFIDEFFRQDMLGLIIKHQKVSENFLLRHVFHPCFLNNIWRDISRFQELSEQFIAKFAHKVDWKKISKHQKLSEQFIAKFAHRVDWFRIFSFQTLSEGFILDNFKVKFLPTILRQQKLSEEFLGYFNWSRQEWSIIYQYQKLSEQFIEKHSSSAKNYWIVISQYQELSEKFISKHWKDVNWLIICQYQKLSEQFIEQESYHFIPGCWKNIYINQEVSEEFMLKHFDDYLQSFHNPFFYPISKEIQLSNACYYLVHNRTLSVEFLLHLRDILGYEFLEKSSKTRGTFCIGL